MAQVKGKNDSITASSRRVPANVNPTPKAFRLPGLPGSHPPKRGGAHEPKGAPPLAVQGSGSNVGSAFGYSYR